MFDLVLFLHLAGLIIGLGAVTVIDTLGFVSRHSKYFTMITIGAHHVTKPLIWVGGLLVTVSWILMLIFNPIGLLEIIKSILLVLMIANGCYLSFVVSPRLIKQEGKKKLLPLSFQHRIAFSMLVSVFSWWSFVILTVISLS